MATASATSAPVTRIPTLLSPVLNVAGSLFSRFGFAPTNTFASRSAKIANGALLRSPSSSRLSPFKSMLTVLRSKTKPAVEAKMKLLKFNSGNGPSDCGSAIPNAWTCSPVEVRARNCSATPGRSGVFR